MKRILATLLLLAALYAGTAPSIGHMQDSPLPTPTDTVAPTATATPTHTPTPPPPTATPQPAPSGSGIDFGAFNRDAIPVELQAWWQPAYGHTHAAALVPIGGEVSGTINLPVRVVYHDNPGKFHRLDLDDDSRNVATIFPGDLTCPNPGVCAWSFTLKVDTTKEKPGWRQWRLQTYTNTPDGKVLMSSSGIMVNVTNPGTRSDYSHPCNGTQLIGRGWYTDMGYTNAMIDCVPLAPVKGTLTVKVRAQQPSDHLTVELDKSHYIPATGIWPEQAAVAGVVLFDKAGDYQSFFPIAIDTTKLGNGWHALSVRSHSPNGQVSVCSGCPTEASHTEGVARMWFYVNN